MIYNTHSHFYDTDKEKAISLLKEKEIIVNAIGIDIETSKKALEFAHEFSNVYAVCGLQPEEVSKYQGDLSDFIPLFSDERCISIGEIGLDYYYGKETKDTQLYYFEKQLEIATNYNKPIMIHCRDAHEDTYNLLEKYYKKLDGIILHCYTGSVEMMQRYLKLGAYISFSGVVTFKNAKVAKEVAIACPLDRILVETDDPYLTPHPFRGQENHPSYVSYVIDEIARLKGLTSEEVEEATYNNALKVFHL